MDDTLYPVIALPSNSGDCSDAISAIASLDSSWIHQRMKLVQHQNNDRQQHRRKSKTSLEEKRLECIENFIVTVVKGKLRTGKACWPKTELKLLMSSQPTPDEKAAEECRAIVPYTQHRKTTGGQSRRASTGSRHCNRGTTSNSRLATSLNPISEKKKDDLGETNHSLESSTKVDALDEEDDDNGRPTKNKYLFPPFHSEVRANMPKNNFIRRESHDNTSAMSGLTMPSALLSSDDHQPMAGWVIQEKQHHYTGEPRGGIARRATMPELSHQAAPRLKTNCRGPSDDKDDIMLPMPPALSLPIPPIMITRAGSTDPPPSTDNNNKNNNNIAPTSSPPQPRRTPPQTRRTPPPPSQGDRMLPLPSNKAFPPPPFNPKEPYLARSRSNSNNRNSTTPAADSKEPVSSSKHQSQIFVVPGLPPVARPKSLMVVAEELHIKASSKDVGVGTGGGMTTKQLFDNKQRTSSKSSALRGRGGDPPSSHEYHRKRERVNQTTTRKKTSTSTATARINNHHLSSSNRVGGNIGSGNKTSGGGGGGGDLNPKKKQPSSNTKVATATTNTTSEATTSAAAALDNNKKVFVSHWGWRKQTIHRRASTGSTNVASSSTRGNTRGSMQNDK